MEWFPEERLKYIVEELKANNKVKVSELAETFQVTMETVRRDLDQLAVTGLAKRVYGGAVSMGYPQGEPPLKQRTTVMMEAKQAIGREASQLITDGTTIAIDTGTTVLELAHMLKGRVGLTIVTHSLAVAAIIAEKLANEEFKGELIMLGGQLNPDQQSITGMMTVSQLREFNFDQAFISIGGMSLQNGISDYDLNETIVSKEMIKRAKEIIVLADHSKIGVDAACNMTVFDQIDVIICSEPKPKGWQQKALENIKWIEAKENWHESRFPYSS
ncbi:DeoR/GlpR family DNA-binding transcription regulator [Gracilibacillus alcaliphilus]|uniref:DeoR/GlpR family DNA-binding transcription regulator n=1 Tax=Gracilibacillus alcaliphilus TaxID=1401441 RepID=UPI003084576A|nr:DeoR/GlpR family transcriptional regulator of sugar metabolism [Gracilibacillus alcaliphilus]